MREALRVALERARRERAERVLSVGLRIGARAAVVPEALALAFEVVTEGTIAAGARLVVEPAAGDECDLAWLEVS